jgi:hypothetical protein
MSVKVGSALAQEQRHSSINRTGVLLCTNCAVHPYGYMNHRFVTVSIGGELKDRFHIAPIFGGTTYAESGSDGLSIQLFGGALTIEVLTYLQVPTVARQAPITTS